MMWLRALGRKLASIPGWIWAGLVGALVVGASALAAFKQGQRTAELEDRAEDAEALVEREEAIAEVEEEAHDEARQQIEAAIEEELEAEEKPPTWEEVEALEAEADAWDLSD